MKVATVSLALLLSGCFSAPYSATTSTSDGDNQNLKHYVGKYIYGFEVSSFQACDSSKVFWVNGDWTNSSSTQIETIYNASLAKADKVGQPYQPIYIEFMGEVSLAEPVGFEDDYDGVLILRKLERFSSDIPPDC